LQEVAEVEVDVSCLCRRKWRTIAGAHY